MDHVILVDEQDKAIGTAEKLAAHEQALLHRAFSIFIVRYKQDEPELLLQQRAKHKYHSPGMWTNTCCSHPRPDETVQQAAGRRLYEEMGFSVPLQPLGVFKYQACFDNGLTEYEIDHVLMGEFDDICVVSVNPEEIMAYRWVNVAEVEREIEQYPKIYTPWFLEALAIVRPALR